MNMKAAIRDRIAVNDLSRSWIATTDEGVDAVVRVLRSGRFLLGEETAAFEEELGMARDLRAGHREPHVREEPALSPLADVALRRLVGLRPRGADDVEAHLRAESAQLRRRHARILPQ